MIYYLATMMLRLSKWLRYRAEFMYRMYLAERYDDAVVIEQKFREWSRQ